MKNTPIPQKSCWIGLDSVNVEESNGTINCPAVSTEDSDTSVKHLDCDEKNVYICNMPSELCNQSNWIEQITNNKVWNHKKVVETVKSYFVIYTVVDIIKKITTDHGSLFGFNVIYSRTLSIFIRIK